MNKALLLLGGGAAICLAACLVAPDEPSGTSADGLTCRAGERTFNGSCRKICSGALDCSGTESCMNVSADVAVCLDYTRCAYLGSDTTCRGGTTGYASYGLTPYDDVGGLGYGYGYGSGYVEGCTGDATWQVIAPSGDPQCGEVHTVTRCAPAGNTCVLVTGSAIDVAER